MKVELSLQVVTFVRSQAPESRRRLRLALRRLLATGDGDIRALEGPLQGYHRLRVGSCRVVFAYREEPCVHCLYAERRDTVYTVFSRMLERQVLEDD